MAGRRVKNGCPIECGGDRSVPETMKHAFMDAAAERLICCVACMRMYVCLEINTCSAAMDDGSDHQNSENQSARRSASYAYDGHRISFLHAHARRVDVMMGKNRQPADYTSSAMGWAGLLQGFNAPAWDDLHIRMVRDPHCPIRCN
jgi:hypothetical protein